MQHPKSETTQLVKTDQNNLIQDGSHSQGFLPDVLTIANFILDLLLPKTQNMNTSVALSADKLNQKDSKSFDIWTIAIDVAVPYLLDNVFFKGTKGRLVKLVGTVAAQQVLKALAKSKAVDQALDSLEKWLLESKFKSAETYPHLNEAVDKMAKKRWNKTKPEDYYDPEREMFY